jgi:hypothetical protein
MDKFIASYISHSNAGADSENNELGERQPITVCRQHTDNYLRFDISVVLIKHHILFLNVLCVNKRIVTLLWFQAS